MRLAPLAALSLCALVACSEKPAPPAASPAPPPLAHANPAPAPPPLVVAPADDPAANPKTRAEPPEPKADAPKPKPGAAEPDPELKRQIAALVAIEPSATIPQDHARMAKRKRDALEWSRRTLAVAYDEVGHKDPRWDRPAHEALDLAARAFSTQVDPEITLQEILVPARAAQEAGCDDPLILYLIARVPIEGDAPGFERQARTLKAAARALQPSRYPAFRRLVALRLAGTFILYGKQPSDADKAEAETLFAQALALVPESARDDQHGPTSLEPLFEAVNGIVLGYRQLGVEPEAAWRRVDDVLARAPELKAFRLMYKGHFWFHRGWEARTSAYAVKVPAGGFETLARCLAIARPACEEAWNLQPDVPRAAALLMEMDKGSVGDRDAMELWFQRAMTADGDCRNACWTKLEWLHPKWHGSYEQVIDFARQCRDTRNWSSGIPILCADTHSKLASQLYDAYPGYLALPEVWSDIAAVYEDYLAHRPDDHVARSKYAMLAYRAKNRPVAFDQFEILGDNLTSWPDAPSWPLEKLKEFRDSMTRVKDGKVVPRKIAPRR